jgi:hypothetical protein
MRNIGKSLTKCLYAIPIVLMSFLPGCEPDEPEPVVDKTPPEIYISSPLEKKVYDSNIVPFGWNITDENYKSADYSLNNGTRNIIGRTGEKNLDLNNGDYVLSVSARDMFQNYSSSRINFSVNKIILPPKDTIPPKITISSPEKGKVYDRNDILFMWDIEEENFKSAWYSLNNETRNPIEKSGITTLYFFENGDNKITIGAEDLSANSSKDSSNFSVQFWKYLVNPFVSTNTNGAAYDLLKTRAQRDSLVQAKLLEDWDDAWHIHYNKDPLWDCSNYTTQLAINFHGFPGLTGYSGDYSNLDSLYYYGHTLKDNGKYGFPVYGVELSAGGNHAMNAILTGNDITKFEDWDFIEPQRDQINVQPGQAYMPENCEVGIFYAYVRENEIQGKFMDSTPILIFKVENKIGYLIFENTNPNLKIIKQREK